MVGSWVADAAMAGEGRMLVVALGACLVDWSGFLDVWRVGWQGVPARFLRYSIEILHR